MALSGFSDAGGVYEGNGVDTPGSSTDHRIEWG